MVCGKRLDATGRNGYRLDASGDSTSPDSTQDEALTIMKSNRRKFIQALGTGSAGVAFTTAASGAKAPGAARGSDEQLLQVGDEIAVADTQYGKVRGYVLRGINYFLGIPYGADTSGANRFMPPQKPKPWSDVIRRSGGGTRRHKTWRTGMRTSTPHSATTGTMTM
jgi:hypothetical protein